MTSSNKNELRQHWLRMANELGFEIVVPYYLNYGDKSLECFAFLPQFGSNKGMIVDIITPPENETSSDIFDACKELGIYCSFINYDSYVSADRRVFCEALIDWGYFGIPKNKPRCIDELDEDRV